MKASGRIENLTIGYIGEGLQMTKTELVRLVNNGSIVNATIDIIFNRDVPCRRFTVKKGEISTSKIVDNGEYYTGCTGDSYMTALESCDEFFLFDKTPIPMSYVGTVGMMLR